MERKLYKSSNDRVLTGVCGGIGEYFAIDSVIVRLLWVVFIFMGGAGLIAYIIAAIIIPERNSNKHIGEENAESNLYGPEERNTGSARRGGIALGIALIFVGGFVLLKYFIPWIPEDMILAVVMIGLGIFFVIKKR